MNQPAPAPDPTPQSVIPAQEVAQGFDAYKQALQQKNDASRAARESEADKFLSMRLAEVDYQSQIDELKAQRMREVATYGTVGVIAAFGLCALIGGL